MLHQSAFVHHVKEPASVLAACGRLRAVIMLTKAMSYRGEKCNREEFSECPPKQHADWSSHRVTTSRRPVERVAFGRLLGTRPIYAERFL